MATTQNVYDAVDYGGFINPNSHPNQVGVMALLHGLSPAAVAQCRVLELGCNEGRNLIPMAYAIPGASFLGVDLAAEPVARGQQRIESLGLNNIRLLQGDLLDLDASLESFDYIIAHGVYAWVPEHVRDRLLALCRELLAPEGVAFVSYNAFPGGHLRNLVKDMLVQHLEPDVDAVEGVQHSLDYLRFIIESMGEDDAIREVLKKEMAQLERKGASIIFHDELAEGYGPVSFSDFIRHAERNGLQYISEAIIPPPTDPCFQPRTAAMAKALAKGDPIAEEQTLDFIRFRMYRETLLCRADRPVDRPVIPNLDLRCLGRLRLACLAEVATEDVAGKTADSASYTVSSGLRVDLHHPGLILAVDSLIEAWPRSLPMATVEELLGRSGFALDNVFVTHLFRAIVARLIQLRVWEPPVGEGIGDRPRATATSREDAAVRARGATLIHTVLDLSDPLVRQLLMLLDGTRDRAELVAALHAAQPEVPEELLRDGIEATLQVLYRGCVLAANDFD